MVTKDELIDLVNYSHAELVRFASALPEEERLPGEGDRWTGRDTLAHVVESERRGARRLAANARGDDPPRPADFNQANAEMVDEYRTRPWEDLASAIDRARDDLLALVDQLSVEQLNDSQFHERLQGRPPWQAIAGSAVQHSLAFHIRTWYIQHGQAELAGRVAEEEAQRLRRLDDSPGWRATLEYNLACHHALCGEREKALQKLAEALQLNPDMAVFARQDTDLVSLYGDPEFEALAPAVA